MGIIGFVFTFVFRKTIPNYYLFVLAGLLPWAFFSMSADHGTTSITTNRDLIKKSKFPKIILPLSIVLANLISFAISIFIIAAFLLLIGQINDLTTIFLLVLALLWLTLFTAGSALFTSALHPFFRDISFLVRAFLRILFYATPIIYPLSIVPDRFHRLFWLNPLSGIIFAFQSLLAKTAIPFSNIILAIHFLMALAIFIIGLVVFKNRENYFDDYL